MWKLILEALDNKTVTGLNFKVFIFLVNMDDNITFRYLHTDIML